MPQTTGSESLPHSRSIRDFFRPRLPPTSQAPRSHITVHHASVAPPVLNSPAIEDDSDHSSSSSLLRGPVRPRTKPVGISQTLQDESTTPKRGPGRPRRLPASPLPTSHNGINSQKRGVGRPRKTPIAATRSTSRSSHVDGDSRGSPGRSRKTSTAITLSGSQSPHNESVLQDKNPVRLRKVFNAKARLSPENESIAISKASTSPESFESQLTSPLGGTSRSRDTETQGADILQDIDDLDGTIDKVLEVPVPSNRLRLQAVAVPSPERRKMSPPPRPANALEQSQSDARISFSSVSTLTSVPTSTQSSSRRIVKDGMKGVTNSDSGSDSGSDEELLDIWALMPSKRQKLSSSIGGVQDTVLQKSAGKNTRVSRDAFARRKSCHSAESLTLKTYKFNLAQMAARARRRDSVDARIVEMESAAREHDELAPQSAAEGNALIRVAAGSDSEVEQRMVQALERTEALKEAEHFYFFSGNEPLFENETFPVASLPREPWCEALHDEHSRVQAFVSGFVAEMAVDNPLNVNITNWLARQLLHERRDILCAAYIETLRVSAAHSGSISDTLAMLNCFYKTQPLGEERRNAKAKSTPPFALANILRMISFCAPASDSGQSVPSMTSAAILDLALVGIDEHVRHDLDLSMIVAESIETMLSALSEDAFEQLIAEVSAALFLSDELSVSMQCRLILSLPSGNPRVCKLRQQLALRCICTGLDQTKTEPSAMQWPFLLLQSIRTRAELSISRSTDYSLLEALVLVLDIAIGAGSTAHDEFVTCGLSRSLGPFSKQPSLSDAAQAYNKQVDALAATLQDMSSQIRGSGTTQLARTEAKAAIERLVVRLSHNVRTHPKRKGNVFNDDGSAGSLDGFLRKDSDMANEDANNIMDGQSVDAGGSG